MKASMLDMIFIPVILFTVAVGVFAAYYILDEMPTEHFSSNASQTALTQGRAAIATFNYGFMIIAIGLGLGAIAYGYLYPSHPIFIVLGIIMLVFAMIPTGVISNTFGSFIAESEMASVAGNFPLIVWFMGDPLPLFIAVFGIILLIVMYSRIRGGTA